MKLSVPMMIDFLDAIQAGGDVSKACRRLRISRMSAIRWLKDSKVAAAAEEQNSIYRFEYPQDSGCVEFFHIHKRFAEQAVVENIASSILDRCLNGTTQPSLYQGRRVPKIDYERLAKGDLPPERCILVDPITGEPEWETVWQAPPVELQMFVLGAHLRKYSRRQHIEHDHRHSGGIGVMVANQIGNTPRERLPMVEAIEPAAEAVITDATGVLEPGEVPSEPKEIATLVPEPAPPPPRSLSPLQEDLIDRARQRGLLS